MKNKKYKCDRCGNNVSTVKRMREYEIEGTVIYYSYLYCVSCGTEYDVGFESNRSQEIKEKINRYLDMKLSNEIIQEFKQQYKQECLKCEDLLKSNSEFISNDKRWGEYVK